MWPSIFGRSTETVVDPRRVRLDALRASLGRLIDVRKRFDSTAEALKLAVLDEEADAAIALANPTPATPATQAAPAATATVNATPAIVITPVADMKSDAKPVVVQATTATQAQAPATRTWKRGDQVDALWFNSNTGMYRAGATNTLLLVEDGGWWTATIMTAHADGTYDVLYDDRWVLSSCRPPEAIRERSAQSRVGILRYKRAETWALSVQHDLAALDLKEMRTVAVVLMRFAGLQTKAGSHLWVSRAGAMRRHRVLEIDEGVEHVTTMIVPDPVADTKFPLTAEAAAEQRVVSGSWDLKTHSDLISAVFAVPSFSEFFAEPKIDDAIAIRAILGAFGANGPLLILP